MEEDCNEPEPPSPTVTPNHKTAAVNVLVDHDVSKEDAIQIIADPTIKIADDYLLSAINSVSIRYRQCDGRRKPKTRR